MGTLGLLLVGCSLLPGALNAALDGEWQLQAGTNQGAAIPVAAAHPITLKIARSHVGGTAACNQYGGRLKINGTTVKVSELMQTEMACADNGAMASEAAYLAALPKITTVARDGSTLILSGPQVELRFSLVPPVPNADLVSPVWVLDSLISGEVASSVTNRPATLQLNANGTLAASTGCRDVTGHYTISGNKVQVTLDPYDMIACADGRGDQDVHVLAVISSGFSVTIDGQSLTLTAGTRGLAYRVGS